MHEAQIRQRLHELQAGRHLIDELGIVYGSCLADVVAIDDDCMHGFEIKSEHDNLLRLHKQVGYYSQVFDYCTLVGDLHHLKAAKGLIPSWWGILDTDLNVIRHARPNPSLDPEALCCFLWKEELVQALHHKGVVRGLSGKKKEQLNLLVMQHYPLEELRALVRHTLRTRVWREPKPPKPKPPCCQRCQAPKAGHWGRDAQDQLQNLCRTCWIEWAKSTW